MQCSAVIAAAGSGRRMGGNGNKQWILIDGIPMLARTLAVFESCRAVDEIIIVAADGEQAQAEQLAREYGISKVAAVVIGGKTRQESVHLGISRAQGDIVLVHDGARPFVKPQEIEAVAEGVKQWGAAAAGVPVKDTIKRVNASGMVTETLPREQLWAAATPQGFYRKRLLYLHQQAAGIQATDDCMLAEQAGDPVKMIRCGEQNIKITTPEDLLFAQGFLEGKNNADWKRI